MTSSIDYVAKLLKEQPKERRTQPYVEPSIDERIKAFAAAVKRREARKAPRP